MPKLVIYAVCDKIILADDGSPSLITIFNEINVTIPPDGAEIPEDALAPKEWAIFAMWRYEPGDEGKSFQQIVQSEYSDGTPFRRDQIVFTMKEGKNHINRLQAVGFPVGRAGPLNINMWLEVEGKAITERFSFHLFIKHIRVSASS